MKMYSALSLKLNSVSQTALLLILGMFVQTILPQSALGQETVKNTDLQTRTQDNILQIVTTQLEPEKHLYKDTFIVQETTLAIELREDTVANSIKVTLQEVVTSASETTSPQFKVETDSIGFIIDLSKVIKDFWGNQYSQSNDSESDVDWIKIARESWKKWKEFNNPLSEEGKADEMECTNSKLEKDGSGKTRFFVEYALKQTKSHEKGLWSRVSRIFGGSKASSMSSKLERTSTETTSYEYLALDARNIARGDYELTVTVTDSQSGKSVSRKNRLTIY